MGRRWGLVALVLVAGLVAPGAAWAQTLEKRVALVIGNAAYKDAPLKNPVNDARLVAAKLKELGFEVIVREDATREAVGAAVGEFITKLMPGGVSLIYYAGHGIQSRGRNYLIPVDAKLGTESDLRFQAVDIGSLTEELDQVQSRVGFLILDACRNNPFERRMRGASRGLSAVDAARGTLIAYATAPGSVAEDGGGKNGTYTEELVNALAVPNLKAEEVFKRVTAAVENRTNGQQTPWISSSLRGDFIFNLTVNVSPIASADRETVFWQSAQASNRVEEYEAYLKLYPQGAFATLAQSRIAALQAAAKPSQVAAAPAATAVPAKPDAAVDAIDKEYVATQAARLRESPDVKSKQVATLKEGDTILVLGKVKGQPWLQVERKGEPPAYVSAALVEKVAAYKKRKEDEQRQQQAMAPSLAPSPSRPKAPSQIEKSDISRELPLIILDKLGISLTDLGQPKSSIPTAPVTEYTFKVTRGDVTVEGRAWLKPGTSNIERMELGTLEFGGREGTKVLANFTRQTDGSWKIDLAGEQLNLQPYIDDPDFLQGYSLTVSTDLRRLRIDAHRILHEARATAKFDGQYWDEIDINTQLENRSELKARYRPVGNQRELSLYAADASAALQMMMTTTGLARDLRGGELAIKATREPTLPNSPTEGLIQMRDFSLRDTPTGERIKTIFSSTDLAAKQLIADEDLNFSRLEVSFRKTGERIELKNLMALSRGVGITASGSFDLGVNQMNIVGYVSPFRGIGQMLDDNPWVGAFLANIDKQGLIAVPFVGMGSLSEPDFKFEKKSQPLPPGQMREFARLATGKDRDLSAESRLKPSGMNR